MPILAFETSCDETSAAVVHEGTVRSSVISSQVGLHAEYGGVVPELAAREHLKNLMPIAREALRGSGFAPADLEAIAATQGPGLPSALMAGLKAGQAMAFVLGRPFFGVHHHEAHLFSPWIRGTPLQAAFEEFEPNVSLVVSGGHTMLVHIKSETDYAILGSTLDDAAGECFDKVGKLLGLPYPAGPLIDKLAEQGNASAFQFPRPLIHEAHDDFSFSGLKTAVRYFLRDHPGVADEAQSLRNLCASVQLAIVDVLVAKTLRAALRLKVGCVTGSGGVICNRRLRKELGEACARRGIALRLAEPSLCTDNAAMIGVLAERKLRRRVASTSLDADISPGWKLAQACCGSLGPAPV
jgi:N6-L-threonylcarbamoyladenine synthase